MGLQHDNPNALPQTAPRTQRLTADESRAVIARWQQERVEQTGLTDRPALPDVAEGLDIPVEEVQRLLAEVRAQRLEEERALVQEQARMRLAEEERGLTDVRRRRTELRLGADHRQKLTDPRSRWVETRPGVWEDASLPALEADQYKCSPPTRPRAVRMAKALAKIVYCLLILGLVVGPIVYAFVMFLYMMLH